jgi:drug/metabolite transporter (DMT)-like permease
MSADLSGPGSASSEPASDDRSFVGNAAVAAIIGVAILSVMDALIKGVSARVPVLEIVFLRFLFGSLTALIVIAWVRPAFPTRETILANGVRALLIVFTAVCFFYALSVLPLAETMALAFLAPVFIAAFGALILREAIDARVLVALVAGFGGVLVIVYGKAEMGTLDDGAILGALAALASAVTYALAMVLLRARARKDSLVVIVSLQNIVPALILIAPAGFVWITPSAFDWGILAAIGILGVAGHLLLARAFSRAEAAKLAPLDYTSMLWAVLFGYVFFAEVPTPYTFGGAGLIILGALVASRRNRAG